MVLSKSESSLKANGKKRFSIGFRCAFDVLSMAVILRYTLTEARILGQFLRLGGASKGRRMIGACSAGLKVGSFSDRNLSAE